MSGSMRLQFEYGRNESLSYCGTPASSEEHVISEALGCKVTIEFGVCRDCNSRFGHTFEGKFINGLALFLNFFKIPNGQGMVPFVELEGKLGSEQYKFVMTGDGKAEIHPQLLRDQKTKSGHEKEFKLFHQAQQD